MSLVCVLKCVPVLFHLFIWLFVFVSCNDNPSQAQIQKQIGSYYAWESSQGRVRKNLKMITEWTDAEDGTRNVEVEYVIDDNGKKGKDRWVFRRRENRWVGRPEYRRFDRDWFDPVGLDYVRDEIINDMNNIAALAYAHKLRRASYEGFRFQEKRLYDVKAAYSIVRANSEEIEIKGTMIQKPDNYISAIIDHEGKLRDWSYFGEFQ